MCHPLQGRHKTCFFKEQNEDEFFVYGLIFSKDGCQIGSLVFTESHYFLFIFSAIYTSSKMMVGCYCCCQEHNTLEWEKCCLFLKKRLDDDANFGRKLISTRISGIEIAVFRVAFFNLPS